MIPAFAIALRIELIGLLRMRETYTFGLLPALLFVPVVLGFVVLVISFIGDPVLALPAEDPVGIALPEDALDDYVILRTDDPRGAYVSGEADVAVTTWALQTPPTDTWMTAEILAESEEDGDAARLALSLALRELLDERIEAAGGEPAQVRVVARVRTGEANEVFAHDFRQLMWSWCVFMAAYLGCFLVPVRTAVERMSGALEALAVTVTPVVVLYTARLLIGTAFFFGLVMLPAGTLWLMGGNEVEVDLRLLDIVEALVTLLLANAGFLVFGLLASSARMALYSGSYAIVFLSPGFAVPFVTDLPWIPFLGFVEEVGGAPAQGVRIGATLLLTAACMGVVHWLAQGDRVLPPGEGDV